MKPGSQTFDGTPDGIKRIEFKDLKIKLEEPETDHFAFVLLDDPVKPGKDGENLELRIGTRRTGGRIITPVRSIGPKNLPVRTKS